MADDGELGEAARDRILSEKLWAELALIRESVQNVPAMQEDIAALRKDMTEVKGELVVHREILREHSMILKEHSADLKEIKTIVGGQQEVITELKLASHTH